MRSLRGFTLVELMVVIVIVVVLAGLAFLAYGRMSSTADTAVATSRIKGLAEANSLYAGDHNGNYVSVYAFDDTGRRTSTWDTNRDFWRYLLGTSADQPGFAGNLPESVLDPVTYRAKQTRYTWAMANYGYVTENMRGGGYNQKGSNRRHKLEWLRHPATTCMFITATDWQARYTGRFLWAGSSAVEGKTSDGKIAYRHNDKALAVFYDGRVEAITRARMQQFDERGGRDNAFWGGDRP